MKKLLFTALTLSAATLSSCTGNFEEINDDRYGLEDSDLPLASFFVDPQMSIYFNAMDNGFEYQLIQNLSSDMYSGYVAVPTAFMANNNNSLYSMVDGWNSWALNMGLLYVMKPVSIIMNATEEPDFRAIAKILRVAGMQKVTDLYGPIPYSKAMQGGLSVSYDSQEDIYKAFFNELNEAVDALTMFVDANGEKPERLNFDRMCGKSHKQWVRYANSLKLRLAMRIVKVEPALAKGFAEAAVAHKYGVLTSSDPNVMASDPNIRNPFFSHAFNNNDCCLGASFESIMTGYDDPRLPKMALPVGWKVDAKGEKVDIIDANGKATNSIGQYKGIRNGFTVPQSAVYKMYALPIPELSKTQLSTEYPMPILRIPEVYFLRAEGALRGWNMGGTAEEFYEKGVEISFAQYNVSSSYTSYIDDDVKMAKDYVDPQNAAMNIKAMNNVTIKWDDNCDNEVKLQRIITQKWIANFPEGMEAWCDFRRTGYPKIFPIVENRSGGTVPDGEYIKRHPFCLDEKTNNPEGVASGLPLLKGPDHQGTRLWWDVDKPNF